MLTRSNSCLPSAPPRTTTRTLVDSQEDGHHAPPWGAAQPGKAGCALPGAPRRTPADVSLRRMSRQQSWRQRCPGCGLMQSPWEVHSVYQSRSSSILAPSARIICGLGHVVRGRWGLEISIAVRVVHILSVWFGALDWEKMVGFHWCRNQLTQT